MRSLVLIVIGLSGLLVGSAGRANDLAASAALAQSVVLDHATVIASTVPGLGQPAMSRSQAIALAAPLVPDADQATKITAQYARLTLQSHDGQVIKGVQSRPAWLVEFVGVLYDPLSPAEAATLCSCEVNFYRRPNTVVVIDAHTGASLVTYGLSDHDD